MTQPIWKDYYVELGATDVAEYRITCNGEVIYTGKAWRRPGEDYVSVKINGICANYLQNVLPKLSPSKFSTMELPVTFEVEAISGGVWMTKASVRFLYDYSYDSSYDAATMGMAFPINHKVSLHQWVVWSGLDVSEVSASVEFADGSSMKVIIPVAISQDFNADFNNDFTIAVRTAASGTAVFKPAAWGKVTAMTINGVKYDVVDNCNRYVLYYLNAYGGWDSLLIEGNHKEIDNLKRHTREVEVDNRSVSNRSRVNYVNEVEKMMTLHTSWMTDEQSLRMHHLWNSTNVYLYDMEADEMIPVLLNSATTEYKTYKNNGRNLVNYTIEATYANKRIRR